MLLHDLYNGLPLEEGEDRLSWYLYGGVIGERLFFFEECHSVEYLWGDWYFVGFDDDG